MIRLLKLISIAALAAAAPFARPPGSARPVSMPVVGIFRELVPPGMQAPLSALEEEMTAAGFRIARLHGADLAMRIECDVLLYPSGPRYPAGSEEAIQEFLKRGGKLVVLGAPAFTQPAWNIRGEWRGWEQLRAELQSAPPSDPLFDFERPEDAQGWTRASNAMEAPGGLTVGEFGSGKGRSLQVDIGNLTGWDNWGHAVSGIPGGRRLITFHARGEPQTGHIMMELVEKDGSRWIAVVPLSTRWTFHALSPEEFKYWQDSPGKGRGGPGDRVRLSEVTRIAIGLAFSHTPVSPGRHRFWIDEIQTHPDPRPESRPASPLVLDGLTPEYKYFPVRNAVRAVTASNQGILPGGRFPLPDRIASVSPRPQGIGYGKRRRQRFIPLIQALDSAGRRAGYLAWMHLNGPPEYPGSAWAVFGVKEPGFYADRRVRDAIVRVVAGLGRGPALYEGGAEFFAYFADDRSVTLGAQALVPRNVAKSSSVRIAVSEIGGKPVVSKVWPLGSGGQIATVWADSRVINLSTTWIPRPAEWARGRFRVRTELRTGSEILDAVEHDLAVWRPRPESSRQYVSVRDGGFRLGGKRWTPHGANYMPSSGIATEDNEAFEYWLDARAYDPDIVEEDLSRIAGLGMNSISAFLYHRSLSSRNLLDLLMRAGKHRLKVNLSLRPHADPFDFRWSEVKDLITFYRLRENDTLFAYDLAWERGFGTYRPSYSNVKGRMAYDADWKRWVSDQYGSIESAEQDWGMPIPRREGEVTGPSDEQLDRDGPWRIMVAAYRRFVDDLASRAYGRAARLIRQIDPNHLISFRMNTAGDPTAPPRDFPFDFRGLSRALDIMQPEGYGRLGDWNHVKIGAFTAAYSRYAAPGRPVYWAEFGRHVWSGSNFLEKNPALDAQAQLYDDLYRMMALSRADGSSCWWFPGGYRTNENSDYGILNPDGSPRPVTSVIRRRVPELIRRGGQAPPAVDTWIEVDRDADSRGLRGIYEKVKDAFWRAVDSGRNPGLRDAGAGATSVNAPLLAVGNTPYTGRNPPKYLNAEFDRLEIRDASGIWVDVTGDPFRREIPTVEVKASAPLEIRASIGNTGAAAWIAAAGSPGAGTVHLATPADSELQIASPIPILRDTQPLGSAEIPQRRIGIAPAREAFLALRMTALDRMWFGERLTILLRPR